MEGERFWQLSSPRPSEQDETKALTKDKEKKEGRL
jgi:hypothetical protein